MICGRLCYLYRNFFTTISALLSVLFPGVGHLLHQRAKPMSTLLWLTQPSTLPFFSIRPPVHTSCSKCLTMFSSHVQSSVANGQPFASPSHESTTKLPSLSFSSLLQS